jgi:hypothetical protein
VEHDVNRWFAIPWHDSRKAAACCVELARFVTPPVKSGFNASEAAAASEVECTLQFVESYVEGTIHEWAVSHDDYDGSDPVAWIYHAARSYGEDAYHAAYRLRDPGWHAAGEIARLGCTVVQKWAANSTGGGAVPNIMLEKAVAQALDLAAADYDDVSAIACKWRFHDALADVTEPTEELRLAFEAAWDVAQYEFAYQLCRPLDPDVLEEGDGDRAEVCPAAPAD